MDHIAAKPPKFNEINQAPIVDPWLVDLAKWLYEEVQKELPTKPTGGGDKKPAPDTKPKPDATPKPDLKVKEPSNRKR